MRVGGCHILPVTLVCPTSTPHLLQSTCPMLRRPTSRGGRGYIVERLGVVLRHVGRAFGIPRDVWARFMT